MWVRNNSRLRTSSNYYKLQDSYSIPSFLRQSRAKYKDYLLLQSLCSGIPDTRIDILPPTTDGEEYEEFASYFDIEDAEEYSSINPSSSITILRMIGHRLLEGVNWISHKLQEVWFRTEVQTRANQQHRIEGIRRLYALGRSSFRGEDKLQPEFQIMDYQAVAIRNHIVKILHGNDESQSSELNTYLMKPNNKYEVYEICVQDMDNSTNNAFAEFLMGNEDIKTLISNDKCASLIWIISEQTRIVLINEIVDPQNWSLLQWYRKFLSDIALNDSIIIGHPYYWNSIVHHRLSRAVKQFKRMYAKIEMKKKKVNKKETQSSARTPKLSPRKPRFQLAFKNAQQIKVSYDVYGEENYQYNSETTTTEDIVTVTKQDELSGPKGKFLSQIAIPISNFVNTVIEQWNEAIEGYGIIKVQANKIEPAPRPPESEEVFEEYNATIREFVKTSRIRAFLKRAGLLDETTEVPDRDSESKSIETMEIEGSARAGWGNAQHFC